MRFSDVCRLWLLCGLLGLAGVWMSSSWMTSALAASVQKREDPPRAVDEGLWNSRCRCETIVDQCAASLEQDRRNVLIRTDTYRCALVDWTAGGVDHQTATLEYGGLFKLSRKEGKQSLPIEVKDCRVCYDKYDSWLSQQDSGIKREGGHTRPFMRKCPMSSKYYPEMSLRLGETGTSIWAATIDRSGRVVALTLTQSTGSPRLDEGMMRIARQCLYTIPEDATDDELLRPIRLHFTLPKN